MTKSAVGVSVGSDASMSTELEGDGKHTQMQYAFEGRLLPVAPADAAHAAFDVLTSADTDLVTLKPTGATFARIMNSNSSTGTLMFWDSGRSPGTDSAGFELAPGVAYDVANLEDLTNFLMRALTATVHLRVLWYKRR